METLVPRDERDTIEVVRAAIANATPLEVSGAGTKSRLGRPVAAELRISTTAMSGVSLYEPSELVLSAGAGTPIREITDLLAQRGQELAFEPMDYGALYGVEAGSGTIGGLIAVNASGPRRIKAGAARDHLLGFRAVSGRAEAFKSGGRVMKNVTGYDLSKLVTGSHGTLAILTEVTVKVLPKAEAEETLLILGLEDDEAIQVLTEASGLPHEISSFAHAPAAAAASMNGGFGGQSVTALRLEGPPVSIAKRKQDLVSHFKARCKEFGSLDAPESNGFWTALRDALPLAALDADIWRISTAPAEGARFVSLVKSGGVPLKSWFYDWAGGLVWLAVAQAPDCHEKAVRSAVDETGGHATLIRAPEAVRAAVPVFHPQPPALATLSARVKNSFDPERILNRGRMREDL
jgi:glycolate oxidase FAD binding subunit